MRWRGQHAAWDGVEETGPDALLFRTGCGGWEPTLGIDRSGAIFYAARNRNVDPLPLRSADDGVTWEATPPGVGSVKTHTSSLDPYLWIDTDTGAYGDVRCGNTSGRDHLGQQRCAHPPIRAGPRHPALTVTGGTVHIPVVSQP
jgi:hypothetical protein